MNTSKRTHLCPPVGRRIIHRPDQEALQGERTPRWTLGMLLPGLDPPHATDRLQAHHQGAQASYFSPQNPVFAATPPADRQPTVTAQQVIFDGYTIRRRAGRHTRRHRRRHSRPPQPPRDMRHPGRVALSGPRPNSHRRALSCPQEEPMPTRHDIMQAIAHPDQKILAC